MKNILVVDDEIDLADCIASFLEMKGYQTSYCESVDVALEKMSKESFDLIISDIKMPGKDGLFLFNTVKEHLKSKNIQFVFMTGNSEKVNMRQSYEMGVDEFLAKPFDLEDLLLVTNLLLKGAPPETTKGKKFCKVDLKEFILANTNHYDIYLKIDNDYLGLVKKGQELLPERLKNYERKGTEHIYLTAPDFLTYINVQFKIADTAKMAIQSGPKL